MLPIILFFGTGILTVKDFRALSWDVLMLMGGGLCLGAAITQSGLAAWLIALFPVGGLSIFWIMALFGTLACVMSAVMSNTATANLVMRIVLGLSVTSLGPVIIGVAFACSMAMRLPVSTPPNAMAFSLFLAFTTGYWWWRVVGLF